MRPTSSFPRVIKPSISVLRPIVPTIIGTAESETGGSSATFKFGLMPVTRSKSAARSPAARFTPGQSFAATISAETRPSPANINVDGLGANWTNDATSSAQIAGAKIASTINRVRDRCVLSVVIPFPAICPQRGTLIVHSDDVPELKVKVIT